jgi:hypothetical protein
MLSYSLLDTLVLRKYRSAKHRIYKGGAMVNMRNNSQISDINALHIPTPGRDPLDENKSS